MRILKWNNYKFEIKATQNHAASRNILENVDCVISCYSLRTYLFEDVVDKWKLVTNFLAPGFPWMFWWWMFSSLVRGRRLNDPLFRINASRHNSRLSMSYPPPPGGQVTQSTGWGGSYCPAVCANAIFFFLVRGTFPVSVLVDGIMWSQYSDRKIIKYLSSWRIRILDYVHCNFLNRLFAHNCFKLNRYCLIIHGLAWNSPFWLVEVQL